MFRAQNTYICIAFLVKVWNSKCNRTVHLEGIIYRKAMINQRYVLLAATRSFWGTELSLMGTGWDELDSVGFWGLC